MNKTCEFCGQIVEVDAGTEAWQVCRCNDAVKKTAPRRVDREGKGEH